MIFVKKYRLFICCSIAKIPILALRPLSCIMPIISDKDITRGWFFLRITASAPQENSEEILIMSNRH